MENTIRSKDNPGKILGRLEQEILEVLWARGEATGKAVFSEIKGTREIALTTVLTVLERLCKKGFVKRTKGDSVYIFSPAYTKEGFAKEVSGEVLRGIFEISRSGACASFVDTLADTDPVELDRLSVLIEKKKKELERKR
ncbi:MAG: BlaI/MecI/CopY family transcriptional regulator [Deltaproteobacteria bacterium]|nr:BlaI/MecI/CopY family transcriptional regulator [Deltaproteobacteria bacterium]